MVGTNFVFSGVFKCLSECMYLICCGFAFFKPTLTIANDFFFAYDTRLFYSVFENTSYGVFSNVLTLQFRHSIRSPFLCTGQIMPSSLTSGIFSVLHTLRMTLRCALRSVGLSNLINAVCMLSGPAALLFRNLSIAISTSSVVGLFNHSVLSSSSSDLFLGLHLHY